MSPTKAKAKAKPPADPEEAMSKALTKIDRAGIRAAVAAGASLDRALHSVVYAETKLSPKDVQRAKLLLALGADPAFQDDGDNQTTVLFELSFAPNQDAALEILEAMLKKQPELRAKPNRYGVWPLHVALWYGKHPAYWDKLVALGNPISPINDHGSSPMFDAVSHDNQKGIRWLLAKGATLDGTLAFANAPEHYCSARMVRFLEKLLAK